MDRKTDYMFVLISWVGMIGTYYDGYSHLQPALNEKVNTLSGFFHNPGHIILYSSTIFLTVLLCKIILYDNDNPDFDITRNGLVISLIGALTIIGSGFLDLLWHLTFGVENIGLSTQLSPPHMMMVFGGSMLVGIGYLVQKWYVSEFLDNTDKVFSILMATFILSMNRYLMQTFSPVGNLSGRPDVELILSLLLQSSLLIGMVLVIIDNQSFLPGTIFMFLFLSNVGTILIFEQFQWALFLVIFGFFGELGYFVLSPRSSIIQFRLFATVLPIIYSLSYFLILFRVTYFVWPIHVWTGTIMLTGYIGLLLSYLAVKPYNDL